jgi:hypothetical protein
MMVGQPPPQEPSNLEEERLDLHRWQRQHWREHRAGMKNWETTFVRKIGGSGVAGRLSRVQSGPADEIKQT